MKLQVWRSFARLFEESRRMLGVSFGLSILQSAALVPVALVVKHVFDTLVPQRDVGGLVLAGAAILGMYVLSAAIGLGNRYLLLKAVMRGITKLRGQLLERVYGFPRAYFDRTSMGKLHSTIVPDTQRLDTTANALLGALLPSVIVIAGLSVVLVLINAMLVLALAAVMPVLLVVGRWLGRKVRRRTQTWHLRFDTFNSKTQLALRAITLAKVSSAERVELAARKAEHDSLGHAGRELAWAQSAYSIVQNTVAASAGIITLVLGGRAVARGEMTIGSLLSFYAILALVLRQVTVVMFAVPQVTAGYESMVRLEAILGADEHEPYEGGRPIDFRGGVELDAVTFSYGEEPLLHEVSMRIEPGEHAALFGPNGAGKSTIVSLILGLYRPRLGKLAADGVPYDEVDIRALRKDIGVVLQDPVIFPGTIAQNIAYGRPDATEEEIRAAAEVATAAAFVDTLPQGYDTEVGDEGGLLSGGQRQRIAIARALIARPSLLILDEPTTYLDDRSITRLFHNLLHLEGAPSVLVISHDPEVVSKMDTVHHLRDGHIVRTESHRPSISVIVPVYNCEAYLATAIDSILAEGYKPLEIIVVDDGSTDRTAEVARSRPVRVVSRPHEGVAAARNAGVAEASGDLICFLDADDEWVPGSLARRVDHLLEHELDYVLGQMEIFLEPGSTAPSWLPSGWLTAPQQGLLTTFVGRRELFDTVGRFDETFPQGEDTEWLVRLKDASRPGARLEAVCARYRLHGSNLTQQDRSVVGPLLLRAIKLSLDRRGPAPEPQP